jgi:rod shape determining protein RodA
VGVGIVLLLYLVVIGESLKIAFNSKDWFGRLVIVGIVTLWSFHLVINIGMTIGVAPVTGLPLPWLSYGGTFMMTNLMMVGLILNIGLKRYLV